MVKIKTQGQTVGGMGFDLGALGDSLDSQLERTRERQKAETKAQSATQKAAAAARKASQQVADESFASQAATRQQQMEILSGLQGQIEKANTAIALADSDNPLDRLNLWFLQQSDASYTREGNLARMAYLQEAANAIGGMEAIQQGEFTDRLAQIKNDLDNVTAEQQDRLAVAQLAEQQGQQLIDAETAARATRLGALQTQNAMQQQALMNLTDDQVATAVQTASASPTQAINVSGVDVGLAALQERQEVITTRRYNERIMQASLADTAVGAIHDVSVLQELQTEALNSPGKTVMIDGTPVSAGKIQDRIYAIQDQEFQRINQQYGLTKINEDLLLKAQGNILSGMQVGELERIIDNGYVDPVTSIRYDPVQVRNARDARGAEDVARASQGVIMADMSSPTAAAVDAAQYVESIAVNVPATSPAASTLAFAKTQIQHAAGLLNSDNLGERQVAHQLLVAARESADAALTSEAKRLAGGDKDLEAAYAFQLRGQPIPQDLVEQTISAAVQKGTPIGRWLSPAQNATYVTTYRAALADAMNPASAVSVSRGGMPMETAEAKMYAADQAMIALKNQISEPISTRIMLRQAVIPGHPINGIISVDEFGVMLRNADEAGFQQYADGARITVEEARARAGTPELVAAQASALYQALEKKQPGLGDAYVNWWKTPARDQLVSDSLNAEFNAVKGDFARSAELALIAPSVPAAFADNSMWMQQGKENLFQADLIRQHGNYVTFGNDPQAKQIFMLEQTPGLTSTEKQIAMQSVIQPLLDLAGASGYTSADQITSFVETQLRSYEPQNPQARSVLRKLLTGRDAALKIVDDFLGIGTELSVFGGAGPVAAGNARNTVNKSTRFQWYQDLLNNGAGQLPPPRMNSGML